jgi:hypothetical protein
VSIRSTRKRVESTRMRVDSTRMRYFLLCTHVMSVEVLAGLPPIRQRFSFLNERLLVSALVKPKDLLMVKLEELHRIWMNSTCLAE